MFNPKSNKHRVKCLVTAFFFGLEALKSPLLMLACVERRLNPQEAVLLARLEEEFQVNCVNSLTQFIPYKSTVRKSD